MSLRSKISTALNRTILGDVIIKAAERHYGVRYPHALIGRRNISQLRAGKTNILVIAAHQDDEVLGVGSVLAWHRSRGDRVVVVYTTNGAGGNWRDGIRDGGQVSAVRFAEASAALGIIDIPERDVICLGFPDGGLHRYLREVSCDIVHLLSKLMPDVVYVHALEGGHSDHDMTSYIVQVACRRSGIKRVFEWCEYNRDCPLGRAVGGARFSADPYVKNFDLSVLGVSAADLQKKNTMTEKYISQAGIIKQYPFADESVRAGSATFLWRRLKFFTGFSLIRLLGLTWRL